jgi:hypothetical protein
MIQNPTPTTRGSKKASKLTTGAPLKRDINLISNRESQEKFARRGLTLIAILVFAAGFAYFAILVPMMQTNDLDAKLKDVNAKLASYSKTEAEFTDLTGRRKLLEQMLASVNSSDTTVKSAYDIVKMIEKACPNTIELTSLGYTIDAMTLAGNAASDQEIAQFLVNLQSYPDFASVMVNSVTTIPPQENKTDKKRMFQIVANFPPTLATEPPDAATPAPTSNNGGSGK